jgi:hypothetical protein
VSTGYAAARSEASGGLWRGPTAVSLQVFSRLAPSRSATREATPHEHQPVNRAARSNQANLAFELIRTHQTQTVI